MNVSALVDRPGHDALWQWFGLGRASWLTLPRVLMHEMPDEWQGRMAQLLSEMEAAFPHAPELDTMVSLRQAGKFKAAPDWLAYRHPDADTIARFR